MMPPDYSLARLPRAPRRFTVLLPVLRLPEMLPFAVGSVLAQSETDFELCVICDGAPTETVEAARHLADTDPRIHVFPFPKGLRHGEAHRAAVLDGARSEFVAQIGDDDLWLPDHLERLSGLLSKADFVSVPSFTLWPDRRLRIGPYGNLALTQYRERMQRTRWNFFGPTEAGYRLSAYRKLPDGWAPGPDNIWSDLNMWRKFLWQPGLRFLSGDSISSLKFATPDWTHLSLADRAAANAAMWGRLQDRKTLAALRKEARLLLARSVKPQHLLHLMSSDTPRHLALLHLTLLRLRVFGRRPGGQPFW